MEKTCSMLNVLLYLNYSFFALQDRIRILFVAEAGLKFMMLLPQLF